MAACRRLPATPDRLNQVFLNLLVNAQQAIADRGEIRVRTFLRDGKVHIEITDTGRGIPEDQVKNIFDPGFTTKGVGVGTGLGLSICYKIMQDHHGEIQVRSEVGKGSTFTVILPSDLDKSARVDLTAGAPRSLCGLPARGGGGLPRVQSATRILKSFEMLYLRWVGLSL